MFDKNFIKRRSTYEAEGLKVDIEYQKPPSVINFLKVPYTSEKLNAKGVAASRRFISKNYGKSLVFPSISKFRQFLNIDFVKNSAYEILDTENKVIDMVERYANFEDIICCYLETEVLGVRYNVPNAHITVTYQFSV